MAIELSKDSRLLHYRIVSKIGAGGMGDVYLAEDTKLDRKVAIKFLRDEYSKDSDKLARFIREAKAASALNHPHILTVYEIGDVDNTNYIATEFIEGSTLRDTLKMKEPFQLNHVLKIGVQVSEALAAAHAAGIIHRDIKPENIMIRKDGYAKVLDFGLAKLSEQKPSDNVSAEGETKALVHTNPGTVMGTANYMSPEQARGKETDLRTDIWSLGVVLYEMLAGRVPFSGETSNHTIIAILEKEPHLLENVPDELQRIIRKSLTKDADMRYQSARDMLIDLKNLRRDLDIQGELERSVTPNRETHGGISGDGATYYSHGRTGSTQSGQIPPTQSVTTSSSSLEYAVNQAKSHKLGAAVIALVLIALIGAGGYFAFVRGAGSKQISSIAVMPFVNASGNPDTEYLSDGMTESLIAGLSQVPNLSVKGRSSVFRYKGKETDPGTVGKELNVQAILNGRVLQRGDNVTLTLELIDTSTENVIWSDKYDRRSSDLANLQSEIARDVSQKLKSKLSGDEAQKVAKAYTANAEAYQLYLKGMFQWNKRNPDALRKAVDYFNQAIEKDPGYGLAYAALAQTYVISPDYYVWTTQEAVPKAQAAAKRALELDESLPEAHAALAQAHQMNLQFAEAEQEYKRTIQLNPNYATAHQWYSHTLLEQKRFAEALAEIKRAQELDPLSLIISANLCDAYYYLGRYDEALAQAKATVEMDPSFFLGHYELAIAYEMKGQYPEAMAAIKKALELDNEPYYLGLVSHIYAMSGKRDEALKTLEQMKQIAASGRFISPYAFAAAYIGLGDKEKTLEYLDRGYESRTSDIQYMAVDPYLKDLHSDPRFVDLLRRTGLPE